MHLTDGDRIRTLLARYCAAIDAGDFDAVGELFAHGVLADEHGTPLAAGARDVAAFYRAIVVLHADGTPRTQHLVLNTAFDQGPGDQPVVATSSYLVLQGLPGAQVRPLVTGTYVDSLAPRGDGGWHFLERRVSVRLAGDLRDHLTLDLTPEQRHD